MHNLRNCQVLRVQKVPVGFGNGPSQRYFTYLSFVLSHLFFRVLYFVYHEPLFDQLHDEFPLSLLQRFEHFQVFMHRPILPRAAR